MEVNGIEIHLIEDVAADATLRQEFVEWYMAVFNADGEGEWNESWSEEEVDERLFGSSDDDDLVTLFSCKRIDGVIAAGSIMAIALGGSAVRKIDLPTNIEDELTHLTSIRERMAWLFGEGVNVYFRDMGIRKECRSGMGLVAKILLAPLSIAVQQYGAKFGCFWTTRESKLYPLMVGVDIRLVHEIKESGVVILGDDIEHFMRRFLVERKHFRKMFTQRLGMEPGNAETLKSVAQPAAASLVRSEEIPKSPFISPFITHCEGTRDPSRYVVPINVVAATVPKDFSYKGSEGLDAIHAFDFAEVSGAYMGQVNLIQVSSFVSGEGLIWGHDIAKATAQKRYRLIDDGQGNKIPCIDGSHLVDAAGELFGSAKARRFPLAPGTHCPAAYKAHTLSEEGVLYAACGLGITDSANGDANIFMEDVGTVPTEQLLNVEQFLGRIRGAIAKSVLVVAKNQSTVCSEVYVIIRSVNVKKGEVGCAIVCAPYLSLAQNAVPSGDLDALRTSTLQQWLASINPDSDR